MSKDTMIFPEDVVLKSVTKSFYELTDQTGRKYYTADEHIARYESCTHVHCTECGKPIRKTRVRCDECIVKALPEWDGEYPIFVGDEFFEDANDLADWLYDQKITRDTLLTEKELYKALPNMASEIVVCYDDVLAEDQELPKDIQECVDDFKCRLTEFKKPVSWFAATHVKFTREQVDVLLPEA